MNGTYRTDTAGVISWTAGAPLPLSTAPDKPSTYGALLAPLTPAERRTLRILMDGAAVLCGTECHNVALRTDIYTLATVLNG